MKRTITVTHYHNRLQQPVLTQVDVLEPDGSLGRGWAIWAPGDRFNGKRGRKIALGRAFMALKSKKSARPIRRQRVYLRLGDLSFMPTFKSQYFAVNDPPGWRDLI